MACSVGAAPATWETAQVHVSLAYTGDGSVIYRNRAGMMVVKWRFDGQTLHLTPTGLVAGDGSLRALSTTDTARLTLGDRVGQDGADPVHRVATGGVQLLKDQARGLHCIVVSQRPDPQASKRTASAQTAQPPRAKGAAAGTSPPKASAGATRSAFWDPAWVTEPANQTYVRLVDQLGCRGGLDQLARADLMVLGEREGEPLLSATPSVFGNLQAIGTRRDAFTVLVFIPLSHRFDDQGRLRPNALRHKVDWNELRKHGGLTDAGRQRWRAFADLAEAFHACMLDSAQGRARDAMMAERAAREAQQAQALAEREALERESAAQALNAALLAGQAADTRDAWQPAEGVDTAIAQAAGCSGHLQRARASLVFARTEPKLQRRLADALETLSTPDALYAVLVVEPLAMTRDAGSLAGLALREERIAKRLGPLPLWSTWEDRQHHAAGQLLHEALTALHGCAAAHRRRALGGGLDVTSPGVL